MTDIRTPHNFLLHLRNRSPWAARLLDGARSLSFIGGVLEVKIDLATWPGTELAARADEAGAEVSRFFGEGARLAFAAAPSNPERLPFSVNASKYWNHVAFTCFTEEGGGSVLALRKTDYAAWLANGEAKGGEMPDGFHHSWPPVAGGGPTEGMVVALPVLLDSLCAYARTNLSYAQLVMAFPGHEAAEVLEATLYAIRDWGTPLTPPAVLQKYTGRIHYTDPQFAPLGIKMSLSPGRE